MECVPTDNAVVVRRVKPLLSSVPVPIVVVPSLYTTVSRGVPAPGATTLTCAVKVTDCPDNDGFSEEVSVVDTAALFTTCEYTGEVLPAKFTSPLVYTALIECVPAVNSPVYVAFGTFSVANPPGCTFALPSDVTPSMNCTEPVAVLAPPIAFSVADNVTVWPYTEGDGVELTVVVVAEWSTSCERADDVAGRKFELRRCTWP